MLLIAVLTVTVPLVLNFVLGTTGFIPSMITATNVTGISNATGGATNYFALFYTIPYLAVAFVALAGIVAVITKALKFW